MTALERPCFEFTHGRGRGAQHFELYEINTIQMEASRWLRCS